MWALLLIVYMPNAAPVVSTVPGFETARACREAGEALTTDVRADARFTCVKRDPGAQPLPEGWAPCTYRCSQRCKELCPLPRDEEPRPPDAQSFIMPPSRPMICTTANGPNTCSYIDPPTFEGSTTITLEAGPTGLVTTEEVCTSAPVPGFPVCTRGLR